MRRTSRPLCLFVLLCAWSFAGCNDTSGECGGEGVDIQCEPACPVGYMCTCTGCVLQDPSKVEDLAMPTGDILLGCPQQCAGATPYCNPNRLCVACLMDSH